MRSVLSGVWRIVRSIWRSLPRRPSQQDAPNGAARGVEYHDGNDPEEGRPDDVTSEQEGRAPGEPREQAEIVDGSRSTRKAESGRGVLPEGEYMSAKQDPPERERVEQAPVGEPPEEEPAKQRLGERQGPEPMAGEGQRSEGEDQKPRIPRRPRRKPSEIGGVRRASGLREGGDDQGRPPAPRRVA